jgi:hypothetical protein
MINFELKKESYNNYSAVYSEPSTIRWHGYNSGWSDCESTYLKRLDELEKKNEELKKALSFYADNNSWSKRYMRQGMMVKTAKKRLYLDGGSKASNALELNQ